MSRTADRWTALAIALALMLVYNANGREIGSYDSQPTKFAARELLLRGSLTLNHVVGAVPAYAERDPFVLCLDGRYRSAYSPVPSLMAAAVSYPLWRVGLLDITSPAAPSIISVIAASLLTSFAVALLYLAARRRVTRMRALTIAIGLGLGTGLWPLVSQTLWEHETAIFGMAVAICAFASVEDRLRTRDVIWTGVGLALAGLARPQLAPMIAVMLTGLYVRAPRRAALVAIAIVAASGAALMLTYWRWFGAPLGALTLLQAKNDAWHRTHGWIDWRFEGLAGLLISPSRGLLVFSPVVAIAIVGFKDAVQASWSSPLRWCAAAAVVQFMVYGAYSVWWAGHTYGPRYMLDVLPVLVPLAAAALGRLRFGALNAILCSAALAWSITLSATGAFCYPHDEWNTSPLEVNREHSRLWQWSDPQFVRCWRTGLSPQNFQLFRRQS